MASKFILILRVRQAGVSKDALSSSSYPVAPLTRKRRCNPTVARPIPPPSPPRGSAGPTPRPARWCCRSTPATTFIRDPDNQYRRGRNYGRADNPGYDQPQALLTALEGGAASLLFAVRHGGGDRGVPQPAAGRACGRAAGDVLGLRKLARRSSRRWAISPPTSSTRPSLDAIARGGAPGRTRLVWIETPANPLWSVTDIAGAAEIAHAAGALLAVDSTAATPVLTRPIDARRRHRHAFGDQISERPQRRHRRRPDRRARRRILAAPGRARRSSGGAILGSLEAYLLLRGMRTLLPAGRARLPLGAAGRRGAWPRTRRSRRCSIPACPATPATLSPRGRCTAASAACCRSASRGGEAAAIATAARVELWKRATSLGGVESLIEHRASIEGAGTPGAARPAAPVGRHRGPAGPDRRSRCGADGIGLPLTLPRRAWVPPSPRKRGEGIRVPARSLAPLAGRGLG